MPAITLNPAEIFSCIRHCNQLLLNAFRADRKYQKEITKKEQSKNKKIDSNMHVRFTFSYQKIKFHLVNGDMKRLGRVEGLN